MIFCATIITYKITEDVVNPVSRPSHQTGLQTLDHLQAPLHLQVLLF